MATERWDSQLTRKELSDSQVQEVLTRISVPEHLDRERLERLFKKFYRICPNCKEVYRRECPDDETCWSCDPTKGMSKDDVISILKTAHQLLKHRVGR